MYKNLKMDNNSFTALRSYPNDCVTHFPDATWNVAMHKPQPRDSCNAWENTHIEVLVNSKFSLHNRKFQQNVEIRCTHTKHAHAIIVVHVLQSKARKIWYANNTGGKGKPAIRKKHWIALTERMTILYSEWSVICCNISGQKNSSLWDCYVGLFLPDLSERFVLECRNISSHVPSMRAIAFHHFQSKCTSHTISIALCRGSFLAHVKCWFCRRIAQKTRLVGIAVGTCETKLLTNSRR